MELCGLWSPQQQLHPLTSHSPHHAATPISQSPHPIQSPHPQPSPHHAQSQSPHPAVPGLYPPTNLPHQSPTGSAGYATPAPPPQRPNQTSAAGHSAKSPRANSSRTSQQQQQQQQQQQAQQLRLRLHQQQAALYHQYGMYSDLASVHSASKAQQAAVHRSAHHGDTSHAYLQHIA